MPRVSWSAENELTDKIIGAAIEVHRHLGPGLLEAVYEECLCYELSQKGLRFQRQAHLPINYKGIKSTSVSASSALEPGEEETLNLSSSPRLSPRLRVSASKSMPASKRRPD